MSYLVTGGAGFIGSHVAEKLLQRGESVIILDNFNDYYDPSIKRRNVESLGQYDKATVVDGDIRDNAGLRALFDQHGITHIAHMAAMAGVRGSVNQTPLYMDVNLTGTMNLYEAARDYQIRQFVFASTSSVYGKTNTLPFIETDSADRPLASYPASKRAAEILGHSYHHLFGLNLTIVRFFNVYGPAGRPDMMPWRLMQASVDGSVIKIFNNGDISRDWTYIDDTVSGVISALDRPLGYEIVNLGLGEPISLHNFIELIEEYSGRKINTESVPTPPSDPPITYCNNDKAQRLLDFNPQISIQEGLLRTWRWFESFYNL